MTNLALIAGVAMAALCAGVLSGALLWQKYACVKMASTGRTDAPTPVLWDIHSLLNAMNRFAVAAERGNPIDPALVYNLSDYLLHSSLLQREGGWADYNSLDSWLRAHLRILAELRGQGGIPAIGVKMPEDLRRIQAYQLIPQLLWFLQRARHIDQIEITMHPHETDRIVTIKVLVHGPMEDFNAIPTDEMAHGWHLERSMCSWVLQTSFEPRITPAPGLA